MSEGSTPTEGKTVVFGYSEFWSKVYAEYKPAFDSVLADSHLVAEMLNAAQTKMLPSFEKVELAIYLLVSMTASGLQELLILAGNGAGVGAIKISRGMFESAVMAEYLRKNSLEVDDYLEYGRVLMWKRVQQYSDGFTPEQIKETEDEYKRVKPRFTNKKGIVRNQWNKHSIRRMAVATNRADQYDLSYSIAASMHHGNFEGMLAHITAKDDAFSIEELPSMKWVMQALVSGQVYLFQALETLNTCLQLGFDEWLKGMEARIHTIWKRP